MKSRQHAILLVRHADCVHADACVVDGRAGRQRRGPLQHVFERQRVEPLERHPVGEGLKLAAQVLHPEPFQLRVADHHGDVDRVWQHLQNVADKLRLVERYRHGRIVGG